PGGTLTTVYSFCSVNYPDCADGYLPQYAALMQATDGALYGTTPTGGTNCSPTGCGTIFKITTGGTLTTLYSFCAASGCPDGQIPRGTLVQYTNGSLYGTTFEGGANNKGTVFSLSVGLGAFVEPQTTSGKVGATVKILGTNLTGATSVKFNGTAAVFKVALSSEITTTVPTGATTGTVEVTTPTGTLKSNVVFRVTN
ncbi:MAG TPA: choice-of-anchor tandem repeat GloVer-containing protein, partial [Terriglobales bacterium]